MKVSVVLISRQQKWNLGRLIRSATKECRLLGVEHEIVLVDSASTDGTVDEAARYGIRTISLCPNQRLTAAAARAVGLRSTNGEYVLFLDGDMELLQGWLAVAIDILDQNRDIAAVTGERIDLAPSYPADVQQPSSQDDASFEFEDVKHGGGAAIYRRAYIEEVGSFNPGLFSDEEPELCIRLRHLGGYRVVRTDMHHVLHFTEPLTEFSTLIGRARRGLYVGSGQVIRHLWGSPMLKHYIRERGFGLTPGLMLIAGVLALVYFLISRDGTPFAWWISLVGAFVASDAVRKRSVRKAMLSLLTRLLHVLGTIQGLLLEPIEDMNFPRSREAAS